MKKKTILLFMTTMTIMYFFVRSTQKAVKFVLCERTCFARQKQIDVKQKHSKLAASCNTRANTRTPLTHACVDDSKRK